MELTVVVPTHNVERWVDECLESIRAQRGVALRVVVVDDHSTDGTVQRVARHVEEDSRVTLVHASAHGGGSARNEGARLADTEFIAFADGDDIVPPGAYAAMVQSLVESGSDLAIGNFLKFSPLRTWQPSQHWGAFETARQRITLAHHPVLLRNRACWNRVFRTAFWRDTMISFPDVPRSNDIVPMVMALTRAQLLDVVPEYVYLYRERPGNGSMTARAASAASLSSYLEQELLCAELLQDAPPQVAVVYASLIRQADGWTHLVRYFDAVGDDIDPQVADLAVELARSVAAVSPSRSTPLVNALFWSALENNAVAVAAKLAVFASSQEWDAADIADIVGWYSSEVMEVDHPRRAAAVAEELVVRPLLARIETLPEEALDLLVTRAQPLLAMVLAEACTGSDEAGLLRSAIARGDAVGARRLLLIVRRERISADEAILETDRVLSLRGTASGPWVPSEAVELVLHQGGRTVVVDDEVVISSVRGDSAAIETVFDWSARGTVPRGVTAGEWVVSCRFGDGTVVIPLFARASIAAASSPWDKLVLVVPGSAEEHLRVLVKASVPRRLMIRLKRLLSGGR